MIMAQPKMHEVIRGHYDKVKAIGKDLADDFGEEDVHCFRVEVKKLRALLRMEASAGLASIKPKSPQGLRTLYAMTGIIRNLQLQRRGLEEVAARIQQDVPASCLAVLDGRIDTAKKLVCLYLQRGRPFGKQRRQWLEPVSTYVADMAGEEFLRLKGIFFTLPAPAGVPDEETFHNVRKAMKDVLYVWPLLSKRAICGTSRYFWVK